MLSILAGGESYGYEIIQDIKRLSDGELKWTTGSLYPHLHRMEAEGLVVSEWKETLNAPRRKFYRLTPRGERYLLREKRQWMKAHAMLDVLWGAGSPVHHLGVAT